MKKILFFASIIFIYASLSFAASENDLVSSFLDHGSKMIKKNDIQAALMDFSNALIIDPSNEFIHKEIVSLIDHPQLTVIQKVELQQFYDLVKFTTRLKHQISYYQEKIDDLKDKIIEKGYDYTKLQEALTNNTFTSAESSEINWQNVFQEENALSYANKKLQVQKEQLLAQIIDLEDELALLRDINDNKEPSGVVHKSLTVIQPSGDFYTVTKQRSFVKAKDENEISQIKTDLTHLVAEVATLQASLKVSDEKIMNLTNELIASSLKSAEIESMLKQREETVLNLSNEIVELQSRLSLGERIIQEKDEEINRLSQSSQQKSDKSIDKINEELVKKDVEIQELKGMLDVYRDQVNRSEKALADQALRFDSIEKQVNALQKTVNEDKEIIRITQSNLDLKEREIANLNKTIDDLKSQTSLVEKKNHPHEDIVQLNGILEIYQAKLYDATLKLSASDQNIHQLKELLTQTTKEIKQRDELLQQTQEKFVLFSQQLTDIQERVLQMKEKAPVDKEEVNQMENDILQLQVKLWQIENFIKKEVDILGIRG